MCLDGAGGSLFARKRLEDILIPEAEAYGGRNAGVSGQGGIYSESAESCLLHCMIFWVMQFPDVKARIFEKNENG